MTEQVPPANPVGIVRAAPTVTGDVIEFRSPPSWSSGIVPRTLAELEVAATLYIRAGIAPRGCSTPQQVMGLLVQASELNISHMQALQGMFSPGEGRYGMTVKLAIALALRSGELESIEQGVDMTDKANPTGFCRVTRKGLPTHEVRFSYADAAQAQLVGKGKTNWERYPLRMLENRAVGLALSDRFADVLCGMVVFEHDDGSAHAARVVDEVIRVQRETTEEAAK